MSLLTSPRSGGTAFVTTALLLCIACGRAGAQDFALQLPGAAHALLLDIATAGERLVEVGERGQILYSTDAGATWTQARVPTSVMLTRVCFSGDLMGWAVGHDGNIVVSEDGGEHWSLQRDGLSEQSRINEERVARASAALAELRARLDAAAEDAREPIEEQVETAEHELEVARDIMREPVYPPPLMDIWFANAEQGWAAGAFGTLLHTTNGGRFWEDWGYKTGNEDELHFNGVAGDAAGTLYLASEWGQVFVSANGGESWQIAQTDFDGSFFGVLVNPATDSVFAYGLLGNIQRSRDHGASWEELDSSARASLFGATATAEGALVFVGEDGTAVRSDDDGESFSRLYSPVDYGLYGVTALHDALVATGDGGSATLAPDGQDTEADER